MIMELNQIKRFSYQTMVHLIIYSIVMILILVLIQSLSTNRYRGNEQFRMENISKNNNLTKANNNQP
jgi:uncharacterized membrane protein